MVIPMIRSGRSPRPSLESQIAPGSGAYADLWTWTLRQGDFVLGVGYAPSREDASAAAAQRSEEHTSELQSH